MIYEIIVHDKMDNGFSKTMKGHCILSEKEMELRIDYLRELVNSVCNLKFSDNPFSFKYKKIQHTLTIKKLENCNDNVEDNLLWFDDIVDFVRGRISGRFEKLKINSKYRKLCKENGIKDFTLPVL